MNLDEKKSRRWGSNLATQLSVKKVDDPMNYTTTKVPWKFLFFSGESEQRNYLPMKEQIAERTYRFTCGLKKLTMRNRSGESVFIAELDGHVTSTLDADSTEFRFSKKDVKKGGKPTVSIRFKGTGLRNGPLKDYEALSARITFRDHAQMDRYTILPKGRKTVWYRGKKYLTQSNGNYRSEDGSLLPYAVMLYCLMSSGGRESFAGSDSGFSQQFDFLDSGDHFKPGGGESSGAGSTDDFEAFEPASESLVETVAESVSEPAGES